MFLYWHGRSWRRYVSAPPSDRTESGTEHQTTTLYNSTLYERPLSLILPKNTFQRLVFSYLKTYHVALDDIAGHNNGIAGATPQSPAELPCRAKRRYTVGRSAIRTLSKFPKCTRQWEGGRIWRQRWRRQIQCAGLGTIHTWRREITTQEVGHPFGSVLGPSIHAVVFGSIKYVPTLKRPSSNPIANLVDIGNARVAGMSKSLRLSPTQFEWLLTGFYISYICFEWMTLL